MQMIVHQGILTIKKDFLVCGEWLTQELDNTTITAEAKYSINFTASEIKYCLTLHYYGTNSVLYIIVKICKYKAKESKMKPHPLSLGKILKQNEKNMD